MKNTFHKLINVTSPQLGMNGECNCINCLNLHMNESTNFTINLPEEIKDVVKITLSALEIPNTIYSISKINKTNTFKIISNYNNIYIIEIPSGNYNIHELVEVINVIIHTTYNLDIYFMYDNITGRVVFFSNTLEFILDFGIPENDIKKSLGWMLGFKTHVYNNNMCCYNNSYLRSLDNSIKIKLKDNILCNNNICGYISEGSVDISGPRYLFIIVNDYVVDDNKKNTYINIENNQDNNILARVSIVNDKNQICFDNTSDNIPKYREYITPVTLNKLSIKLIDNLGQVVDLNNGEISLLLDVEHL